MWFQFIVINVGADDGYVLILPERERSKIGRGIRVLWEPPSCPFFFFLKKVKICVYKNKCDDIYTVLEMGMPVVTSQFFQYFNW